MTALQVLQGHLYCEMGKKEQVPALAIFMQGSLWVWSATSRGRPPDGGLALAVFHMVPRVPAAPNLFVWPVHVILPILFFSMRFSAIFSRNMIYVLLLLLLPPVHTGTPVLGQQGPTVHAASPH